MEKEIEKCNNLDDLFDLWVNKQKLDGRNTGKFCYDGYVNEKNYKNILFILKEPHIYKGGYKPEIGKEDVTRESQYQFYNDFFLKEKDGLKSPIYEEVGDIITPIAVVNEEEPNVRRRVKVFDTKVKQKEKIARMAYYIFSEGKITSNYEELKNALSQVAYMNINKMGGGDSTNGKELDEYFDKYKEYIFKEIELLKPRIIVVMTKGSKVYEELTKKFNKIKIISMDHTGLWPQLIQNNDDEIKYFNEKIASKYECGNYNQVFNKYCDGKENVFNKDKGPYIRFNKSTLKYLIKFIGNYDKS